MRKMSTIGDLVVAAHDAAYASGLTGANAARFAACAATGAVLESGDARAVAGLGLLALARPGRPGG
jgi:hypothetical protein